jgi:putative endonuclease
VPTTAIAKGIPFARRRAAHLRLGRRGERIACTLLRRLGLDVLTTNYRTAHGEVDIVAREDTTLCFVEVKTRHRRGITRPADAVGREKRRRIVKAARQYLHEIGRPAILYRYDIVEVVFDGRALRTVRHWPTAFSEEERPWSDRLPWLDSGDDEDDG